MNPSLKYGAFVYTQMSLHYLSFGISLMSVPKNLSIPTAFLYSSVFPFPMVTFRGRNCMKRSLLYRHQGTVSLEYYSSSTWRWNFNEFLIVIELWILSLPHFCTAFLQPYVEEKLWCIKSHLLTSTEAEVLCILLCIVWTLCYQFMYVWIACLLVHANVWNASRKSKLYLHISRLNSRWCWQLFWRCTWFITFILCNSIYWIRLSIENCFADFT